MSVATAVTVEAKDMLTAQEAASLAKHEGTIRRNLKACLEVATALLEIRGKRLFRATHRTFESYCNDRWSISSRHANRWILWAEVVESLGPRGPGSEASPPERIPTETQSRPLSRIEPEKRREAWDRAIEVAGGGQPSERQVRDAAKVVVDSPLPTPEEPADVARGRDEGIIPASVEVLVIEEPGEESDGDQAETEISDFDWLETLPARKSLSNEARTWFDAEALAYRRLTPLRRRYRDESRQEISAAKRAGKHLGPWLSAHDRYLRQADPSRWAACKMCDGTGRMELVGKCAACRGHAYHVSGVEVVTDAN